MATPTLNSLEELDELLRKRIKDEKIKDYESFIDIIDQYSSDPDSEIKKGVELFYESILKKEKIKLIHDSDTDGLGTATLSYRFFKEFIPYPVKIEITDRKKGYGFIPEYVEDDVKLYCTADNGITSFDACILAHRKNAKVIITDHHQPEKIDGNYQIPEADAIIDPYKPDCNFEFKDISGTVVYFIFLRELLKRSLKDLSEDARNERLKQWYQDSIDLMAITTLSDVMPLNISINRFLVNDFINNHFENTKHQYLNSFKIMNNAPVASDFSFTLVPALNATQRMASPVYGFNYLIQEDYENAKKWMDYIFQLNESRKAIQQELIDYVEKYYKDWIKAEHFILIPGKFKKEYDGVLGIIAGRIAEKYNKPCIVCNIKDNGFYSGSGRSVGDVNILNILRNIREENPDIFTHIGGHKQACGIGFKPESLNDLFLKLQEEASKLPKEQFKTKIVADFYIGINQVHIWDTDIYYYLMKWEPFGHKFKKPIFKTRCFIKNYRIIGKNKNHLTLNITDNKNIIDIKALWFFHDSSVESKIDSIKGSLEDYCEIYWQPELDSFNGSEKLSVRILGIDF